jgi:hypothetical protein
VVYFIGAYIGSELQAVKIGYSIKHPAARIRHLQPGNHCELRVMCEVPGDVKREKQFHREFGADRLRHEWFRPSEALLALIGAVRAGTWVDPDPAPWGVPEPTLEFYGPWPEGPELELEAELEEGLGDGR